MHGLWIDTDVGTDIDDALALVLAAHYVAPRLKAVSTVSGNTAARARIAMKLLQLCGVSQIPVFAGLPLPSEADGPVELPAQYLTEMDLYSPREDAVNGILKAAGDNENLTIVTLGPLTNIAECIRRDRAVMSHVKLVMMSGMVTAAFPEGNVAADPESAAVVFDAEIPKVMVGLDVTAECRLTDTEELVSLPAPLNHYLLRMFQLWKKDVLGPILSGWGKQVSGWSYRAEAGMHDPMTVAAALWPELFVTEPALIRVETQGAIARGLTLRQKNPFCREDIGACNVELVVEANCEIILARMRAALKNNV